MFDDQINSQTSSCVIDSLEALFKYIDSVPMHSFVTFNEQSTVSDKTKVDDELSNEMLIFSDIMNDLSIDNAEVCSTNSLLLNNTTLVASGKWFVRDSLTGKLRSPKLHEFLRSLLNSSHYTSYLSWLNKNNGLFKIHKPEEVAELWSKVKKRQTKSPTSYKLFSRSIRFYYARGIMTATHKKHTYRFSRIDQ